jgi:hypothetical protein
MILEKAISEWRGSGTAHSPFMRVEDDLRRADGARMDSVQRQGFRRPDWRASYARRPAYRKGGHDKRQSSRDDTQTWRVAPTVDYAVVLGRVQASLAPLAASRPGRVLRAPGYGNYRSDQDSGRAESKEVTPHLR